MTNLAILMDLLKISPKYFFATGFDTSLISRWRTGKRRLMPGRHQVKAIARVLYNADTEQDFPVLEALLRIWYPMTFSDTEAEKLELLELFLTEKGQNTPEYQKTREMRLYPLQKCKADTPAVTLGIGAVRLGLLGFLDLISTLPAPAHFYLVFTEGLFIYLDDDNFRTLFMEKMMSLFISGHRLSVVARSDRALSDTWHYQNIWARLYAHIKGYIHIHFYDDYQRQGKDKILGMVPERFALRVTREDTWNFDHSNVAIYHDPITLEATDNQIRDYCSRAYDPAYYDYFCQPNGWLADIHIPKDQPCYVFTRLPHFGVATQEEIAQCFSLSQEEQQFLMKEFFPLLLNPVYFDGSTTVRHVFIRSDIEKALSKKRHMVHEITSMLNRKVWMTFRSLSYQLMRIQRLLSTYKNYEVCFLDEDDFRRPFFHISLWGNTAAICWTDKDPFVSCKDSRILAGLQSICAMAWEDIPAAKRSREAANRLINLWLKQTDV